MMKLGGDDRCSRNTRVHEGVINGLRKRRGQFYDEQTITEVTAEVKGLIARLPVNASTQEEPVE